MNNMQGKQKCGIRKGGRDRAHHRPVSEHGSGVAALVLTQPSMPASAIQALLPSGHSWVLLPAPVLAKHHLKHLCRGCLSQVTLSCPPGTCCWDRTRLLQSTQAALSGATVQEHPHAWHKVDPAPNSGLVQ